jgi:hypothetical protein
MVKVANPGAYQVSHENNSMCGDRNVFNVGTDEAFFDQISLCHLGLSVGAIIAIVASVVVIVGIAVVAIFILVARRRRSRDSHFELLDPGQLATSADYF